MKDLNGESWKKLIKSLSEYWNNFTLEAATNDLVVHAIAELDRLSFIEKKEIFIKEFKDEIDGLRKKVEEIESKVESIEQKKYLRRFIN